MLIIEGPFPHVPISKQDLVILNFKESEGVGGGGDKKITKPTRAK